MKKLLLLLFILFIALNVNAQADTARTRLVIADFEKFYNTGQAGSIYRLLTDEGKKAFPLDNTRQFISQLKIQMGKIVASDYIATQDGIDGYKSHFEKQGYALFLSIDKDNRIVGLFLRPENSEKDLADTVLSPNNVSVTTPDGVLYGTLTIPAITKKVPVILMIAGSGPTDRNTNSPAGLKTNTFLMLAKTLSDNGIATLRYDKRGSGQSVTSTHEADLKFDDYIKDVGLFIRLLKKDHRFSEIIVLGHSEGSLIGMVAAKQEKADAFISLEGPGAPIDVILKKQLQPVLSDADFITAAGILDSLKKGRSFKRTIPTVLMPAFHASVQPFLTSWIKYDPRIELAKLKTPVLIVQGTTDLQINVEDARLLKQANQRATLKLVAGMNHVLKSAPADQKENLATYNNPDQPLHPDLVPAIVDFINKLK